MKHTFHLPVVAVLALAVSLLSCVSQTRNEPVLPFSADPSCAGLSEQDRALLDKWGGFMGGRHFYDMSSRELGNYESSREFPDLEGEAVRSYRRVSAAGRREVGFLKQCADIAGGFLARDVKRESGGAPGEGLGEENDRAGESVAGQGVNCHVMPRFSTLLLRCRGLLLLDGMENPHDNRFFALAG